MNKLLTFMTLVLGSILVATTVYAAPPAALKVPEFTTLGAAVGLIGTIGYLAIRRKFR